MLFYVDITVVCAVPDERGVITVTERTWHDTVSCRFAINASDSSCAVAIAIKASQHAICRDGDFVGGVVTTARETVITSDDLNGYDPYLIKPLDENGIVYVSGITYSSVENDDVLDISAELTSMRDSIAANGLPKPSFAHPMPDFVYEPNVCRLLCPRCNHWIEFDQRAFMFAFFDGLQHMSEEFGRLKSALNAYQPFVNRHRECFSGTDVIELDLQFLHDENDEFASLDDAMCEGKDLGITKR